MQPLTKFDRVTLAGFAAVILFLAVGMGIGIRLMSTHARTQEARLAAKEQVASLAEALRSKSDVLVSADRSYVSAPDGSRLRAVRQAASDFDAATRSFMAGAHVTSTDDVDRSARTFRRAQTAFVAELGRPHTTDRFMAEIHPAHHQLDDELDRFVDRAEAAFTTTHEQTEQRLHRATRWMYALLGILIVAGFGIALLFARRLSRTYGAEHKANRAAQQASAARDELMGVIAHDLRNPLSAIAMKAAIVGARSESDETRRQAHSIENVAMRMDYLIKTMLDVVTIEAGHFSVKPAAADAGGLIDEVVEMFGTAAEAKQIQLAWKVTPGRLDIRVDRQRLIQVLAILVGNALKFTPEGGRVTITADRKDEHARISVADTGPAIPRKDLARMFERFWRTGSVSQKGTGLGLFLAKTIIAAHGGTIWVESEPDRGTTFHLTLPVATVDHETVEGARLGLPALAQS